MFLNIFNSIKLYTQLFLKLFKINSYNYYLPYIRNTAKGKSSKNNLYNNLNK